jgi:hypothetical protein
MKRVLLAMLWVVVVVAAAVRDGGDWSDNEVDKCEGRG